MEKCDRCINQWMRLVSGHGKSFRVRGVNVPIPENWSVYQCQRCKRIRLTVAQVEGLMEAYAP